MKRQNWLCSEASKSVKKQNGSTRSLNSQSSFSGHSSSIATVFANIDGCLTYIIGLGQTSVSAVQGMRQNSYSRLPSGRFPSSRVQQRKRYTPCSFDFQSPFSGYTSNITTMVGCFDSLTHIISWLRPGNSISGADCATKSVFPTAHWGLPGLPSTAAAHFAACIHRSFPCVGDFAKLIVHILTWIGIECRPAQGQNPCVSFRRTTAAVSQPYPPLYQKRCEKGNQVWEFHIHG